METDALLPRPPSSSSLGASSASGGGITTTRLILLFIGLALAVFVAALDETIVAVAAIYISGEFNAFSLYSWVTVSYLVTLVAAQTVYGGVSNIVGRKGPMVFAACIFLLSSAGCGWAPNMPFFIAARALSGFGAGGMNGLSFIIVADTFPLDERPKYQSILMSGFGAAAVTGPILGGVFTEHSTWRWCFWINLPIVGITLLTLLLFQPTPPKSEPPVEQVGDNAPSKPGILPTVFHDLRKLDWLGVVLVVGIVTCFVLPLSLGGNYWPWSSPQVIVLFAVAIVCLVVFIYVEQYVAKDRALIPIRLMKNKALLAAWASLFLLSVDFTSFLYYIPTWFQLVQAHDPTEAGLQLLPYLVGMVVVGILYSPLLRLVNSILFSLHLDDWKPKPVLIHSGCALFLLGTCLIATMSTTVPAVSLVFLFLLFGAGTGLVLQTSFLAAQASVDSEDLAMANSLAMVFEYLGGAVGLTVSGTIHRSTLASRFEHISKDLISGETLKRLLDKPQLVNQEGFLSHEAEVTVRQVFAESFLFTFKILIVFAGVLFVNAFFVARKEHSEEEDEEEEPQ